MKKSIVILGGGSAGLSAAVRLIDGGYSNVVVVEKEGSVGGLASSFRFGEYKLDYGPHAFHSKKDTTDEIFKRFCPDGYYDIYMKANLLLHGKYFEYPLKFAQAAISLPLLFSIKMLADYFIAQVKRLFVKNPEVSFETWGVKRYGRTMYDAAFGNYSSKVWGTPTSQLHWKMAKQKLPDLNFFELVLEAIGGKGAKQKILYSSYYYPKGGIGKAFEGMEHYITRYGGKIFKKSKSVEIQLNNKGEVKTVVVDGYQGNQTIPCSFLIPTIPIPDTIKIIRPSPPSEVLLAANKLNYRDLILVMIEIDMSNVTNQIMIYLLDKNFAFNRIGEQKNLDSTMIPKNKTVLCMEMCADADGSLYNSSDSFLFELAKKDLSKLNKVSEEKITGYFIRRLSHCYPVYDLTYDVNLDCVLNYLLNIPNVVPLGRQGLFIHNDMHDSMKMGIEGADFILSGQDKSVWIEKAQGYLNWHLY